MNIEEIEKAAEALERFCAEHRDDLMRPDCERGLLAERDRLRAEVLNLLSNATVLELCRLAEIGERQQTLIEQMREMRDDGDAETPWNAFNMCINLLEGVSAP